MIIGIILVAFISPIISVACIIGWGTEHFWN